MKRLVSTLLLLVTIAACAPQGNMPRPGTATTAPPATTTTTPPAVVRPALGPTIWSTPAAAIPTSVRSADWAARLAQNADTQDGQPSIEFGLDAASNDYSTPVYDAAQATTRIRVYQRPVGNWGGAFDLTPGATIPWNPAWLPADGNDGHVAVVDSRTGEETDLWAVSTPTFSTPYLRQTECAYDVNNLLAGYNLATDLCVAGAMRVREPSGATADVRSYKGNYPASGEAGIQFATGLVTPAEVATGRIPHALRMAINGLAAMKGPRCPADVTSPDDPRVGTTCGIAIAPAGYQKSNNYNSSPAELAKTVPQGTRVVIDITDAEIEQWLNARGFTGTLRSTARTFAVALRDYGMIQVMNTPGPWTIPVAGGRNPATAAGWRSLGIADDGSTLLNGLVTPSRLRVLAPPTNRCNGVTTRLSCWSSDTSY